jgi:hypothetical protein
LIAARNIANGVGGCRSSTLVRPRALRVHGAPGLRRQRGGAIGNGTPVANPARVTRCDRVQLLVYTPHTLYVTCDAPAATASERTQR